MTAGWRECADPVELAAAVADGVEVLCVTVDGRTWETGCEDSESFRRCMANDCRYRVPASWSPEPPAPCAACCGDGFVETSAGAVACGCVEPPAPDDVAMHDGEPVEQWRYDALLAERDALLNKADHSPEPPAPVTGDDLRERIARAAAGGYMRVPIDALDGMFLGPPWVDVADAVLAVLPPQPAPSPVPPWPGAVLSGLTDEDGVPTWLAQAGQVRGEQVRGKHVSEWYVQGDTWAQDAWVEVRAPRAVPEPETERVSVWDALMNERTAIGYDGTPMKLRRGQTILYTRVDGGGGRLMYDDASHPDGKRPLVAPDGTVEVLKDGDR